MPYPTGEPTPAEIMLRDNKATIQGIQEWNRVTHTDPFADREPLIYDEADRVKLGRHALATTLWIEGSQEMMLGTLDRFRELHTSQDPDSVTTGIRFIGNRTTSHPADSPLVRHYEVLPFAGRGTNSSTVDIATYAISPHYNLVGKMQSVTQQLEQEIELRTPDGMPRFTADFIRNISAKALKTRLGDDLKTYRFGIGESVRLNAENVRSAADRFDTQPNRLTRTNKQAVHELRLMAEDVLATLEECDPTAL